MHWSCAVGRLAQSVGASVSGGGDLASYFVSADYDDDKGIFEPNTFKRWSTRVKRT